jgi:hypothetical protein
LALRMIFRMSATVNTPRHLPLLPTLNLDVWVDSVVTEPDVPCACANQARSESRQLVAACPVHPKVLTDAADRVGGARRLQCGRRTAGATERREGGTFGGRLCHAVRVANHRVAWISLGLVLVLLAMTVWASSTGNASAHHSSVPVWVGVSAFACGVVGFFLMSATVWGYWPPSRGAGVQPSRSRGASQDPPSTEPDEFFSPPSPES